MPHIGAMRSIVLCALLAAACAAPLPPAAAQQQVKPADIRGFVTKMQASEIRVEATPKEFSGAKAVVKITNDTAIRGSDGQSLPASAIREGQMVSVWFAGEVAQSYPLQATAARIDVE